MAYFDSPKNKAIWERELAQLRVRREARKAGLDDTANQRKEASSELQNPARQRTSYRELLAELRVQHPEHTRTTTAPTKETQKTMSGPKR
ncbi:MAG: hypothetical protein RR185_00290 [Angelakisella sp.]